MSSTDNNVLAYYYGFNEKPMEIRKKCETGYYLKKTNLSNFDIGMYGSISDICLKTNCKYIVKLIPLSYEPIYKTFLREALIAPIMAKHGIGPKIYDIFICLNAGYIIMEKWDSSIRKLIVGYQEKVGKKTIEYKLTNEHLEKIGNLISKMHDKGVIHNDLHTGNILLRKNRNGSLDFCITDFGLSLYFEDKNSIVPSKFVPSSRVPNIFFPAYDFHRFSSELEIRQNIILISFFFNRGYISLIDYLIVDKFYRKDKSNKVPFNKFIQSLYLNKSVIKQDNKIDSSFQLLNSFNKNTKYLFYTKPENKKMKNNKSFEQNKSYEKN